MIKKLSPAEQKEFLKTLRTRFEKHLGRHKDVKWEKVLTKLEGHPAKLWSIHCMEKTGGEPDVIGYDKQKDAYVFCDCSAESPRDRRSLCYDRAALDARKMHKPLSSAMDMADSMGIELLTEDEYKELQTVGSFDLKTSSWLKTPAEIRKRGGAIYGDRRYDHVFIYHNGAESYYAARGFRGLVRV